MPNPTDSSSSNSSTNESRISRRLFNRRAALAAAVAWTPAELLRAGYHSHREPQAPTDLTPEQTQEVEAKLANIVRKWGVRLSDDQRQHLRRILTYNERMLASVRSFPLENGDPPASVLRVSFTEAKANSQPAPRAASSEGKS